MEYNTVNEIGYVHVSDEGYWLEIKEEYRAGLLHLDDFAHVVIVWWFSDYAQDIYRHQLVSENPYTCGPDTLGVFATRSPLRPNPIALTSADILHVDMEDGKVFISYTDAKEGTPILDIKPYTPSFDRYQDIKGASWNAHWPTSIETSGDFDWSSQFNF